MSCHANQLSLLSSWKKRNCSPAVDGGSFPSTAYTPVFPHPPSFCCLCYSCIHTNSCEHCPTPGIDAWEQGKCPLGVPTACARKASISLCSAGHAGIRESAGHFWPETHRLPEAVLQHRWHGCLHGGLRPAAAELLLQHHVPEWPGPWDREAGSEAALLLDRGGHPEQPLPAQGHVLL